MTPYKYDILFLFYTHVIVSFSTAASATGWILAWYGVMALGPTQYPACSASRRGISVLCHGNSHDVKTATATNNSNHRSYGNHDVNSH